MGGGEAGGEDEAERVWRRPNEAPEGLGGSGAREAQRWEAEAVGEEEGEALGEEEGEEGEEKEAASAGRGRDDEAREAQGASAARRPLTVEDAAASVAAAEIASGREPARVARAQRAVGAAADVHAALEAAFQARRRRLPAYLSDGALRRELARAMAYTVAPGDAEAAPTPPPEGDDWRATARLFAPANPPRPRLLLEYEVDAARLPAAAEGELAFFLPAGVYLAHLPTCAMCREAEVAGQASATCEVHIAARMCEGLELLWGPEGEPPPRVAGPPPRPARGIVTNAHADALAADFAVQVQLRTLEALSPEAAADPALCAAVAGMHVVSASARVLPAALASITTADGYDSAALYAAAQTTGAAEARAYLLAAGDATPDTADGRDRLLAAFEAARASGLVVGGKVRPVTHLHRTSNLATARVGTRFPTPADLVGGAASTDGGATLDATRAYQALRLSRAAAAWQVVQDPATGMLYTPRRGVWGSNQVGAAYCCITGLFKEAIRGAASCEGGEGQLCSAAEAAAGPPALQALLAQRSQRLFDAQAARAIRCTGVADDVGIVADARAGADGGPSVLSLARAWARVLAPIIGYTENLSKAQEGPQFVYNGLRIDIPDGPSASLRPQKLFGTYADLALVAELYATTASGESEAAWVPLTWFRSLMGRVEWAATVDTALLMRRGGLRFALSHAEAKGYCFVSIGGSSAGPAATGILQRALSGNARTTRFIATANTGLFSVRYAKGAAGVEAHVPSAVDAQGRSVRGVASDGSLANGLTAFGALVTSADGSDEALWGAVAARDGDSSGSAETSGLLAVARTKFPTEWRNSTVVWVSDSVGCAQAICRSRARYGTRLWHNLEAIHALADAYGVTLLAAWVPRTAMTRADALSHHRTPETAAAWATGEGVALTVVA